MKLLWDRGAHKDYLYWHQTDRTKVKKINELIKEIMNTPTQGFGNLQRLRGDYKGYWSRQIDTNHRLIYKFDLHAVYIVACRYHY